MAELLAGTPVFAVSNIHEVGSLPRQRPTAAQMIDFRIADPRANSRFASSLSRHLRMLDRPDSLRQRAMRHLPSLMLVVGRRIVKQYWALRALPRGQQVRRPIRISHRCASLHPERAMALMATEEIAITCRDGCKRAPTSEGSSGLSGSRPTCSNRASRVASARWAVMRLSRLG